MSSARRFFQMFNLALGRLIALLLCVIGGYLVYVALNIWGDGPTWIMFGIGLALLLIAAAMLYWRITFFGILEFFSIGSWWN